MDNISSSSTNDTPVMDFNKLSLNETPDISPVRFLNVDYVHLKTLDGGDLYVTKQGLPFINNIKPENWYAEAWFKAKREKLEGTSTIYRVVTKKVKGKDLDLVVKWCRFGQDVPIETRIIEDVLKAEFNSPFEEFSLVEELRRSRYGPKDVHVSLQKPLGIYVPPERLQLWQTGRSKYKINSKIAKHPGVEIDILRQYILIYKWVKGLNAVDAFKNTGVPEKELEPFTLNVIQDLKKKGFRVLDQKPAHFIVRFNRDGTIRGNKQNEIPYTLIDFELLERTPDHEEEVKAVRREQYLKKQRDRFKQRRRKKWPEHLRPVDIMGVDYVFGLTESTNGVLWVVGKEPDLFDYFQPERWRKTPRTKISRNADIFYTKTKDGINIVWKVSPVGEKPDGDSDEHQNAIIEHGYNSPFEEFGFAVELARKEIPTAYPRAIYMTGHTSDVMDYLSDDSRFLSHRHIVTPDGDPVLRKDHDYIKVWGFWNGRDEFLATHDGEYSTGINSSNALRRGVITEEEYNRLLDQVEEALFKAGFQQLVLKGNHVLLTINPQGGLVRKKNGDLEFRLTNFELMRKID